jgi:hypothetical protein
MLHHFRRYCDFVGQQIEGRLRQTGSAADDEAAAAGIAVSKLLDTLSVKGPIGMPSYLYGWWCISTPAPH